MGLQVQVSEALHFVVSESITEVIQRILDSLGLEGHMNRARTAQDRRTQVYVHRPQAVQIHDHDGDAHIDARLDFPPHEPVQVSGAISNYDDGLFGVLKTLLQDAFNVRFTGGAFHRQKIVRVIEVELHVLVLVPTEHETVCPHVLVAVKNDVCLILVCHDRSPEHPLILYVKQV